MYFARNIGHYNEFVTVCQIKNNVQFVYNAQKTHIEFTRKTEKKEINFQIRKMLCEKYKKLQKVTKPH